VLLRGIEDPSSKKYEKPLDVLLSIKRFTSAASRLSMPIIRTLLLDGEMFVFPPFL